MTKASSPPLSLVWLRRDLRLEDQTALWQAFQWAKAHRTQVQLLFIFDPQILKKLNPDDKRVPFIHQTLEHLHQTLLEKGGQLWVEHGPIDEVFSSLAQKHRLASLFWNDDYEPRAIQRDQHIQTWCATQGICCQRFRDQVLFEKSEILSATGKPYAVWSAYQKKWLQTLSPERLKPFLLTPSDWEHLHRPSPPKPSNALDFPLPSLTTLGFQPRPPSFYPPLEFSPEAQERYAATRDFPAQAGTSQLGLHLRFGTTSVRHWVLQAQQNSATWLSELIWREFFMQILFHFPQVVTRSFRPQWDSLPWRSSSEDWERWRTGQTGFALIDAGMRELNATGRMPNRVRMVAASFLTKHLLIHWSLGERYFAHQLLDYDLAANNGNWQWAAGSGCDAVPYFRIFHPQRQQERFDPQGAYIRQWVPEWNTPAASPPMVDVSLTRQRALAFFQGLSKKPSP